MCPGMHPGYAGTQNCPRRAAGRPAGNICLISPVAGGLGLISRVGHDNGALEQSDGRRASEESSYGASTGFDPMSTPADTPRRHGYRRRTSSGSRCWLSTSPVSATRQDIPPSSGDSKGCQIRAFCSQSIRPYVYVSPELPPTPLRLGLPRSAVPGAIAQGFPKDPSSLSVQHQALAVRLIPVSLPLPYPSAVAFFVCLVLHLTCPYPGPHGRCSRGGRCGWARGGQSVASRYGRGWRC
jgi:hypothetical protein